VVKWCIPVVLYCIGAMSSAAVYRLEHVATICPHLSRYVVWCRTWIQIWWGQN